MTATNSFQITPFMHVDDLEGTLRFFTDILGFSVVINFANYAYLDREGVGLRVLSHKDCPEEVGVAHGGFAYYIDVRDLSVVQDQIGEKLATLPEGNVLGPIDQPHGQRELIIRVPDGNLLVFGQAIEGS